MPATSISGTVPRLNASMDSAPMSQPPADSAKSCIDCSGPHGISPLSSPTTSAECWPRGRLICSRGRFMRLSQPKPSISLSAIISINAAATI